MITEAEVIDVAAYARQGLAIPAGKKYLVTINGDPYVFEQIHISGRDILSKAGIVHPDGKVIYQIINDADIKIIGLNDKANLAEPDFERFVIKESTIYNYFVDNDPETSDQKVLTPSEILKRAAYKPTEYYLVEILENGQQTSYQNRPDEPISLTHRPKKRFVSIYQGNMPVS